MYTIGISAYGGPDALTRLDVPDPHPDSGEVLVEVAASGVNNAGLLQRRGLYPPPLGAPDWPGLECSGWIAELGDDVFGWKVGDEVCALVSGGAYAQKVVVPMGQLLPVPAGVSLVDAAALPEAVCTVWLNMMQIGRLSPGESVLVHGGAGGVGSAAVQIARSAGARVLATAGSMEKCRFCWNWEPTSLSARILCNAYFR